jgi:hypothetical protein
LSPIGISTGTTAGKNHVGFTNNTAGLLSEMRFFPRLRFTENPHSLPSRWSSSTQPSKCGIFGIHFDRNSEHVSIFILLTDFPHNCLTTAHWKKFPARKHFLKPTRRGSFCTKTMYQLCEDVAYY